MGHTARSTILCCLFPGIEIEGVLTATEFLQRVEKLARINAEMILGWCQTWGNYYSQYLLLLSLLLPRWQGGDTS